MAGIAWGACCTSHPMQAPAGNLSTTGVWWRDEAAGLARTAVNYTCVPKPGGGCSVISIFRQWNCTEAGNWLYIWQRHDDGPPLACTKLAMPSSAVLPPVIAAGAAPSDAAPCPTDPSSSSLRATHLCTEWSFTDAQGQHTSVWVAASPIPPAASGHHRKSRPSRDPGVRVVLQRVVSATGTEEVFIPPGEFRGGTATLTMFTLPDCSFVPPGQLGAATVVDGIGAL